MAASAGEFPVPLTGAKLEQASTYQLHVQLEQDLRTRVGRLGTFLFPAGRYIYTGSARRNMAARLRRHLAPEKALRWHIDYLLTGNTALITRIHLSTQGECVLNQSVKGELPVTGFGASDCRSGCGSHLKYVGQL